MALPPTPLTSLLYGAPTPDAMYEALHSANVLSARARMRRGEVVALMSASMAKSEARYAERPGLVGPTSVDEVARALAASPYLNSNGARMASGRTEVDVPANKSWWQFWK